MADREVVELKTGQFIEIGASSPVGMIFNVEIAVLGINPETGAVSIGLQQTTVPYTAEVAKAIAKMHKWETTAYGKE